MAGKPHSRSVKANDPALEPGGYRSQGTPGEEGDVRRVMRVRKAETPGQVIPTSQPVRGGGGAESTAAGRFEEDLEGSEGTREVYVLARSDAEELETPVFGAGDGEAIAVFSTREQALAYLQTAGWGETHDPAALSPTALAQLVNQAREEGVGVVAVDPGRQEQLRGVPQSVLVLEGLTDLSGDNLYREVQALRHR